MTTQLNIHTPGGDYPIHIGSDLEQLFLEGIQGYREMIVVTDETVEALPHFQTWRNEMNQYADHYLECLVPAGETSKSVQRFSACLSQMAGEAFSRSSLLVALGGGVVGDLGGFLAASYLRGIDFIQVPTTLLAMVDSSVGGKTGINLPEGKNLVGAFYQPQAVFADLSSLSSLSPREFSAGMAEVIKYGLIRDPELLSLCAHPKEMELATIITRCVQIKADVVAEDEKETSGLRAILNFGHTLGHAIEQTSGYGKLLHGEAVSLGMIAATFLSTKITGLKEETLEKLESILKQHQLPVRLEGLEVEPLMKAISRDKKAVAGQVKWVLLEEPGLVHQTREVSPELVLEAIDYLSP